MPVCHFVRVGVLGQVGRFAPLDTSKYRRGTRVVCRTTRGLEIGSVLAIDESAPVSQTDGTLVRRVTTEDDLLVVRLEKNRQQAYQACVRELSRQEMPATLVDVEQLFDGSSIYFYFLGEVPPQVEELTQQLAEAYESQVQLRKFTETVLAGCGPLCGTEDASGGCGDLCSTCSVASACHK